MSNATGGGGGGGGQKTKNLTNREWGSISKPMNRMAQSLESGGRGEYYDDLDAVNADAASGTAIFNAAGDVSAAGTAATISNG